VLELFIPCNLALNFHLISTSKALCFFDEVIKIEMPVMRNLISSLQHGILTFITVQQEMIRVFANDAVDKNGEVFFL